jgi:hypothetical protein
MRVEWARMESPHQRKASEGTEIVNNVETRERDAD